MSRKPGPRGRGSKKGRRIVGVGESPIFEPIMAGKFRQRVTIQQPDTMPDEIGGRTGGVWSAPADTGWSDVATVWASIQTINPTAFLDEKQWRDKQFLTQEWFSVILRYGQTLGTNMRLVWTDKTGTNRFLIIYSVVNIDVVNHRVHLFTREGG